MLDLGSIVHPALNVNKHIDLLSCVSKREVMG